MATVLKETIHYQHPDWFTHNFQVSQNSERSRESSFQVRQEGRYTSNEAAVKTHWDQHDNNNRLADRIDLIRKWKKLLENTLAQLDAEIQALSDYKELTEEELAAKEIPLDTVIECLTHRDGRLGIERTNDTASDELNKEKDLIEKIKLQLQQRISEAFEQLCRLQEARQQIMLDLQDKNEALGIDVDQYNLTEQSPFVSYKPDPLRITKNMTTPQNWEDFSKYNKDRAEAEIRSSTRLREAMMHTVDQTRNDQETERQAVDYQLRKRIYDTKKALDELGWQKKQLEDEIARMLEDIEGLEAAIKDKMNPNKLAQTRLENRLTRPGVENCRDAPHYGLVDEVKQLDATKRLLEEKLKQAQHALDGLEKNLHQVNEDIQRKQHALDIDQRCLDVRQKLVPKENKLNNRDRNLRLLNVERERIHELS